MTDTHETAQLKAEDKPRPRKEARFTPREPFFFELSRLMVVAIMEPDGRLVSRAQTKPNGPWEAGWTPVDSTHRFGVMTAGLTGDGRVMVLAQPVSAPTVLYIDQNLHTARQDWNKPFDLGKPAGVASFYVLATAYDADGRVEVFGIDTNYRIWWKYQNPMRMVQKTVTRTPPGTHTPVTVTVTEFEPPAIPWSNWFQIPGGLAQIKALRNADGRIILFGINSDGHLYRCEQRVTQAVQPSDWTGWVQMDDAITGLIVARSLAPALDAAGAVNLFVIANNGHQILHARQDPPGTATWAPWTTPGLIREGVQAVAANIDGSDHLVLVATDNKQFHNMTRQLDVEEQQWGGWMAIASGGPVQSALNYNADGRLTFFSHTLTGLPPPDYGGLWCTSQVAFDSTEWGLAWTELAPKDIVQFAVVRDLTPPAG